MKIRDFSIAHFIAVVSVLHVILALWLPLLQSSCPPCFLLVFYSFCFLLFVVVFLVNQSGTIGEG